MVSILKFISARVIQKITEPNGDLQEIKLQKKLQVNQNFQKYKKIQNLIENIRNTKRKIQQSFDEVRFFLFEKVKSTIIKQIYLLILYLRNIKAEKV